MSVQMGISNDQELQSAFENCTLPFNAWNHRAHVRVAFLYASQHPFSEALDRMRKGIKAYNSSQRVPEALDRGYHETMTIAFMRLIHDSLMRNGPFPTSEAFCDHHPELLSKFMLRRFYSRERIMTEEAKRGFVEPDLAELPSNLPVGPHDWAAEESQQSKNRITAVTRFLVEDPNCKDNPFKAHENRDDIHFVLYHGTSSSFCDDIERIGFCFDNFKREYGDSVCAIVAACRQIYFLPNGFATASLITVNDKTVWFTPQFDLAREYASNVGSECIDGAIRAAHGFLAFVRDSKRVEQQADHWRTVLKECHHAETQQVLDNLQDNQLIEKLTNQVEKAQAFLKDKIERAFPVVYAVLADFSVHDKTTLDELRRRQRNGDGIEDQRGSNLNIKQIVGRADFPNGINPERF